jgi:peroxiredoxin/outer membrane lipoprotein-sorting protein
MTTEQPRPIVLFWNRLHVMRRYPITLLALIAIGVTMLSCGPAAKTPKQQEKAYAILDSVLKRYRALRSYQSDIELQLSERMQKPQKIAFAFQRPNKVAFINEDPVVGAQIVSDGEYLYVYLAMLKQYTKGPIPPVFTAETLEGLLSKMRCTVPALIMLEDPDKYLTNNIKSMEVAPTDSIGPYLCDVLRLTQNNNSIMQLWIDKRQLIVRKSTTDMTPLLETLARQRNVAPPSSQVIITEWYKNIQLNEPIPPAMFTFKPPAEAREVAQLSLEPQHTPLSPAMGKMAPSFTLEDLDGNTHSLESLKGKAVILSFWTPQNSPSVTLLLNLQKLHERYAAKGLVVLGVTNEANVGALKNFLKTRRITFPVLRDLKESVASQYDVRVLPRLIIIDKNGAIQSDLHRIPEEGELMSALKQLGIS